MRKVMDTWAEGLREFRGEPAAVFPPLPKLETLLEGFTPPQWLIEKAATWSSFPDEMETLRVVGLVGRLATASCDHSRQIFQLLLDREEVPFSRAKRWAVSLSEEAVEDLWLRVEMEMEVLLEDIELGGDPNILCEKREELECLLWVLRASTETPDPTYLDKVARQKGIAPTHYTEHLSCVGWQEPDTWWGYREVPFRYGY